jgi:nitroreductase
VESSFRVLEKIIKERRSIRSFRPEVPDREILLQLIDCARYAPSATNLQPWLFFIITDPDTRSRMAQAVAARLRQHANDITLLADVNDPKGRQRPFLSFADAPVVIAPVFRPYPEHVAIGFSPHDTQRRYSLGLESAAAAVQTLLLAAYAAGLGACWLDSPLIAREELEAILGIRPPWQLMCLVAAGYPNESPKAPRRKKVELITRFIEQHPLR